MSTYCFVLYPHFQLDHVSLLPRDSIRFDSFHLKCSITRRLTSSLRNFLINQLPQILEIFSTDILSKLFNEYHIFIWENRKNFSSFLGNELVGFVAYVGLVNNFLDAKIIQNSTVSNMKK